jgi:hypothetical protein
MDSLNERGVHFESGQHSAGHLLAWRLLGSDTLVAVRRERGNPTQCSKLGLSKPSNLRIGGTKSKSLHRMDAEPSNHARQTKRVLCSQLSPMNIEVRFSRTIVNSSGIARTRAARLGAGGSSTGVRYSALCRRTWGGMVSSHTGCSSLL